MADKNGMWRIEGPKLPADCSDRRVLAKSADTAAVELCPGFMIITFASFFHFYNIAIYLFLQWRIQTSERATTTSNDILQGETPMGLRNAGCVLQVMQEQPNCVMVYARAC